MLPPWRDLPRRSLRLWRAALAPAIPRIGFRGHFLESSKPFVGKMLVTCWSDRQRRPEQRSGLGFLAPRVGFEPTTLRLTAGCSAVELPRNTCAFPSAQGSIIAKRMARARGFPCIRREAGHGKPPQIRPFLRLFRAYIARNRNLHCSQAETSAIIGKILDEGRNRYGTKRSTNHTTIKTRVPQFGLLKESTPEVLP